VTAVARTDRTHRSGRGAGVILLSVSARFSLFLVSLNSRFDLCLRISKRRGGVEGGRRGHWQERSKGAGIKAALQS